MFRTSSANYFWLDHEFFYVAEQVCRRDFSRHLNLIGWMMRVNMTEMLISHSLLFHAPMFIKRTSTALSLFWNPTSFGLTSQTMMIGSFLFLWSWDLFWLHSVVFVMMYRLNLLNQSQESPRGQLLVFSKEKTSE